MTRLLLDHGADTSLEDKWGCTALYYALQNNADKSILSQLLAHGADPDHPDWDGNTPLEYAQEMHRPDIVALLRQNGKKR